MVNVCSVTPKHRGANGCKYQKICIIQNMYSQHASNSGELRIIINIQDGAEGARILSSTEVQLIETLKGFIHPAQFCWVFFTQGEDIPVFVLVSYDGWVSSGLVSYKREWGGKSHKTKTCMTWNNRILLSQILDIQSLKYRALVGLVPALKDLREEPASLCLASHHYWPPLGFIILDGRCTPLTSVAVFTWPSSLCLSPLTRIPVT